MTSLSPRESALGFGPIGSARMAFSGFERNKFFYNRGGKELLDLSYVSGLSSDRDGRAFTYLDWDGDGDLDVVVVNRNAPVVQMYRNDINPQTPVVRLTVRGDATHSNRDAIGASASLVCGDQTLTRAVTGGSGFASSTPRTLRFPCSAEGPHTLTVRWPSGRERQFKTVENGKAYDLAEDGPLMPAQAPGVQLVGHKTHRHPLVDALPLGTTRVAYVTFWASWCASCKKAQPDVDALAKQFGDRVEFVGLSLEPEDTPEVVTKYEQKWQPAYRLLALEPAAHVEAIDAALSLFDRTTPGMPAAAILDTHSGALLWHSLGVASASDLERILASLPAAEPAEKKKKHWIWAVLALLAFCGWLAFINVLAPD